MLAAGALTEVEPGDSLAFRFLRVRSGRPARRGEPDLLLCEGRVTSWVLVPSSMGERAGMGARLVTGGEGSLVALVAVAFLSFGRTHRFASGRSRLASAVGFGR